MEFPQKKSRVIPTNCVKQYNGAIVRTSYIGVRREREKERQTDRETDRWTDGQTKEKKKKEMRERERDEIDHINWERVQFFLK